MLVDEAVDALVGHEQQDVVNRAPGRIDVAARGQLLHPGPDIFEERPAVQRPLGVARRLHAPGVVGDGELGVHVQQGAAGQQEGEVGHRPGGDGLLLEVADALDQAGRPQDVVGDALAPLPPGFGTGQDLAQGIGRTGEAGGRVERRPERGVELTVLAGTLPFQAVHDRRHSCQLVGKATELTVDHVAGGPEPLVGDGHDGVDHTRTTEAARIAPHDQCGDHRTDDAGDEGDGHEHGRFHGPDATKGVRQER